MNWYYSLDGKQAGPITDTQLDEQIQTGEINWDTLVWKEGMKDWLPLKSARAGSPPEFSVKASLSSGVKCAECGRDFPSDEVVMLDRAWVCAGCKPIFLQRIREGATASAPGVSLWRKDKQLVTRLNATFPDRCVKCNAPANGYRLKRQLTWHPPAYYFFILLNLLVYALIAMCVQKKATLFIGLCPQHRTRRTRGMIVGWVGFLGGIVVLGAGIGAQHGALLIWTGILMMLGGLIYGVMTGARVSAAKITKENVWLKGVDNGFLAELPEWPEH